MLTCSSMAHPSEQKGRDRSFHLARRIRARLFHRHSVGPTIMVSMWYNGRKTLTHDIRIRVSEGDEVLDLSRTRAESTTACGRGCNTLREHGTCQCSNQSNEHGEDGLASGSPVSGHPLYVVQTPRSPLSHVRFLPAS